MRIESIKPFDDLPMPQGNHFLWGHVPVFMNQDFQKGQAIMAATVNEHGRLGHWSISTPTIVVTHWEDVRAVLLATDSRKISPLIQHHLDMIVGPRNFLLLQGREWKFHRSAIFKSLTGPSSVANQRRSVIAVTTTLIESLHRKFREQQQLDPSLSYLEMDVELLMKMVTMDVFGKAALSTNLSCCQVLALSPVASAFDFLGHDLTRRLHNLSSLPNSFYSIPTQLNRKHRKARSLLIKFMEDLIQQRRAEKLKLAASNVANDILSFLLQAHEEAGAQDKQFVTEQTLRVVLLSLLFAGYDTTSVCLTYTLFLLATHPQAQQHCFDEVMHLKKNTDVDAGASDGDLRVESLVYCKAVIMEALRLYPPAFTTSRHVDKILTLARDGYSIPAGTGVIIPIWTIQRLERHFPMPNEFRPDRWVHQQHDGLWVERIGEEECDVTTGGGDRYQSSAGIAAANHNAFFAFSAGSRSCPGQRFAMQEATLGLAALVREFRFHNVPGYKPYPIRHGIVQCSKEGMPLRIEVRC